MAKVQRRRQWSDAEKEEIIREQLASGQTAHAFSVARHLAPSWFRNMKQRFFDAHPDLAHEIKLIDPVPVVALSHATSNTPFPELSDSQKISLMKEYKLLPPKQKKPWRKIHQATQSQISYYFPRLVSNAPEAPKKLGRPPKNLHLNGKQQHYEILSPVPHTPPTLDEAIAAFEVKRDQLNSFIEELKRMRSHH